ncbi:uncharacterized protein LOC134778585 [Penaeus indicus]|uniref:uncharacterized protein LOC134778585 n=1 Tax=Penaeus indicus TaxID=29960 RepID=UPI00300C4D16
MKSVQTGNCDVTEDVADDVTEERTSLMDANSISSGKYPEGKTYFYYDWTRPGCYDVIELKPHASKNPSYRLRLSSSVTIRVQSIKAVIVCCLVVAVSAGVDRSRGGRGSNRFLPGGLAGVHGGGVFGGGIHGGGIHGGIHGGSAIIGGGISNGPSECRYWCKTPEGQAYCCETVHEPETPVGTKPLDCPQVRPTCPRFNGPPTTCSNDYKCAGLDKCCFDRCLGEHVCKPPSFFNNHLPF